MGLAAILKNYLKPQNGTLNNKLDFKQALGCLESSAKYGKIAGKAIMHKFSENFMLY